MAEPTNGDKIEVKTLKNTNLKPADLSKAIEDSTKVVEAKPKPESPKGTKPATPKTEKAKGKPVASDTSQIIVKNRSTYVGPKTDTPAAKPVESITHEAKVDLKPPSAMGKTVGVAGPAKTEYAQPPPPSTLAPASVTPEVPVPAPVTLDDSLKPAAAAAKPPAAAPQQALKVFDTNEYHLPIKPTAGRHYMNGLLSWTILILVFALVGGYVLVQLEVIDPNDFGL